MTPRSQILALPATATLEEAARHYHSTGHTKIPIYGDRRESVVGVLYARDLLQDEPDTGLAGEGSKTVADFMRDAYFVPETKSVADLFYTFRKRKLSLALTIDEFGGVTGLATMEDLLECIFGEILSGSELMREQTLSLQDVGERTHRVDGAMTIQQFNRLMGANLEASAVETIGGLLLNAFGELPSTTSRIVVDRYEFTVDAVADQRIAEVTVRPLEAMEELDTDPGESLREA